MNPVPIRLQPQDNLVSIPFIGKLYRTARLRAIEPATGFILLLLDEDTMCLNLPASVGSNVLPDVFLGKAHFALGSVA